MKFLSALAASAPAIATYSRSTKLAPPRWTPPEPGPVIDTTPESKRAKRRRRARS